MIEELKVKIQEYYHLTKNAKELYDRANKLFEEEILINMSLNETVFLNEISGVLVNVRLVDNFAEKNTVYRSAGIKQYELIITEDKK